MRSTLKHSFVGWVFLWPLILVAGCAGTTGPAVNFPDIHGLAVDPNDSSVLYVATHWGLFKGEGDSAWSKVSQVSDDFMGFTMHPSNSSVMYASGHPGTYSRDDWSLGIIKSTDGGATWSTLALKNEVDFHAMTVSLAAPDTIWGSYKGALYESIDGGAAWTKKNPTGLGGTDVLALASSPTNASHLYAGTSKGLYRSSDGGRAWFAINPPLTPEPLYRLATTPSNASLLWGYFASQGFAFSQDSGRTWREAADIAWGPNDGIAALAFDPTDSNTVYAGSARGAIYKTADAGASWTLVKPSGGTTT